MREIKVTNAAAADEDEVAACLAAVAQFLESEEDTDQSTVPQLSGWHQAALLESTGSTGRICDIRSIPQSGNLWQAVGRRWTLIALLVALCGASTQSGSAQNPGQQAPQPQLAPPVLVRPPVRQIATSFVENPDQGTGCGDSRTACSQELQFQAPAPGMAESSAPLLQAAFPQALAPHPALMTESKPTTLRILLSSGAPAGNIMLPTGAKLQDMITGDILADLPPQSQWQIIPRLGRGGNSLRLSFLGTLSESQGPAYLSTGNNYRSVSMLGSGQRVAPNMVPLPSNVAPHFWLPATHADATALAAARPYMFIPSDDQGTIQVAGKPYRGSLLVRANLNGGLDIINYVDLEAYLKSVVSSEMPSAWPLEALKAQAIAARSYAIAAIGKHESDGYDLKADIEDQVYKGAGSESPASVSAVNQTRGEVLRYQGKVISAFFHSASGGSTELAENVWGRPVPYLHAVADYDDDSPNFCWSRSVTTQQAEQMLTASGKSVGALLALMPISRGVSPRVRWMLASGTEGSLMLTGEQARKIFALPSACFNILGSDNCYMFAGRGSGHGLGMSQWGAKRLAEAGMQASDILKYYFKDVTAEQL
jgi:stage II sporulation protein D